MKQYPTGPEGVEYIAVCIPAFSADTVHRDEYSSTNSSKTPTAFFSLALLLLRKNC